MKNTYIFSLLTFLLITIPIVIYYDLIFNNPPLYVVEIPVEIAKPSKCIFDLFYGFFKVTNSSYVYCPSHFVPVNIKSVQYFESLPKLDYIRQEQYIMLKNFIVVVLDNLGTLHGLSN
jgi:hypothetical protein